MNRYEQVKQTTEHKKNVQEFFHEYTENTHQTQQ